MWESLKPLYIELLRIAWNDAAEDGIVTGAFDVENEFVQDVLKELALRVTGIDETTQEIIQMIIGRQASEGWSVDRVRDELLNRAVTESKTRAELIGRTEVAHASEAGNHLAWKESGQVVGVEWLLGPNPCPTCQSLSGKVVRLGEEFAPGIKHAPAHPACVCATAPRVD